MPYYNMSIIATANNTVASNQTTMLSFVQGINSVLMFGWLGNLLLLGLYCIILIAVYTNTGDILKAFTSASYISFVLSLGFVALNLCHPLVILLTSVCAAIGVAVSFRDS